MKQRKTKFIGLNLTPEQEGRLKALAKSNNLTLAAYVRNILTLHLDAGASGFDKVEMTWTESV